AGSSNRPGTQARHSSRLRPDPDPGPAQSRGTRAPWELIDLDDAELYVGEQLQRVGDQLLRHEVKTETSEAPCPCPGCVSRRSRSVRDSRTLTVPAPARRGSRQVAFTTRHGPR